MNKELVEYGKRELEKYHCDHKQAEYLSKYIEEDEHYKEGIQKLIAGIPIQYVIGNVNFYGYPIKVNPSVLIPRFETEELVYKTISYIKKIWDRPVRIVDIGTGSGCIAITLKKELEGSQLEAVDISEEALAVAKENAEMNGADIRLLKGDMLEPLTGKYDVIISNPPYISFDEEIMEVVKNNEPHLALYADQNGLEYYQKIFTNVVDYWNTPGLLAFEIGETQGERLWKLARQVFPQAEIVIEKDMQGRDRFLFVFDFKEEGNV